MYLRNLERKDAGAFLGVIEKLLKDQGIVEKLKAGTWPVRWSDAGRVFEFVVSAKLTLRKNLVDGFAAGTAKEFPVTCDDRYVCRRTAMIALEADFEIRCLHYLVGYISVGIQPELIHPYSSNLKRQVQHDGQEVRRCRASLPSSGTPECFEMKECPSVVSGWIRDCCQNELA